MLGWRHNPSTEGALMPESFQPTQSISATLEAQEWNVVLAALQELPFRVSAPVIQKLRQQLMPEQIQEAQQADNLNHSLRAPGG